MLAFIVILGFELAKQALYHFSHASSLCCLVIFEIESGFCLNQPGLQPSYFMSPASYWDDSNHTQFSPLR
jgi:hypothetical protein